MNHPNPAIQTLIEHRDEAQDDLRSAASEIDRAQARIIDLRTSAERARQRIVAYCAALATLGHDTATEVAP